LTKQNRIFHCGYYKYISSICITFCSGESIILKAGLKGLGQSLEDVVYRYANHAVLPWWSAYCNDLVSVCVSVCLSVGLSCLRSLDTLTDSPRSAPISLSLDSVTV